MNFLKTDIPFGRDDAHRLLPAIVAAMVAITALLLAVGISFAGALDAQKRDAEGSVQVQISATGDARARATAQALSIMKATQGVSDAVVLKDAEVARLLKPWLGDADALSGIAMPVLIDLKTRDVDGEPFDADALRAALKSKIKDVRVETPEQWVGDLAHALSLAQGVLLILALCLAASLVALVVLVARTSLRLHFKTVNLLHLFGATDDYILRQFQIHNAWMVGRGALVGSLAAALLLAVAYGISGGSDNPVLPQVAFGIGHGVLFVLLPVCIAAVSLVATRMTVQDMLQRMH